jgi:glutamyl endopeptidase
MEKKMNRLSRLLIIMIALILAVPLAVPTAPAVQAQDGGPVRNGDAVYFPLSGGPAGAVRGGIESVRNPEIITGNDNMKRLTSTTGNPWRATAKLDVTFPSGSIGCTGFFVSPTSVVTSGSCVYDPDLVEAATAITVTPALNGTTAPFGSADATGSVAHTDWVATGDPEWDLGVVTLGDTTLGDAVGTFMQLAAVDPEVLYDGDLGKLTINGYPLGKEYKGVYGTTQWKDRGDLYDWWDQMLYYQIDTVGQAGSPVWGKVKGAKYVVAVHTREGYDQCDDWYLNCGVLITPDAAAWLAANALPSLPIVTTDVDGLIPLTPLGVPTNQKKQVFSWEEIVPGTYAKYEFELWHNQIKFDDNGMVSVTWKRKTHRFTSKTTLTKSVGTSGLYEWAVRGIQANGLPGPWAGGTFILDVSKPLAPTLLVPVNKSTLDNVYPQTLAWEPNAKFTDPFSDDIAQFEVQIKAAGDSWANADVEYVLDPTMEATAPNGTWQWRVRAIDGVGNTSPWSKVFKFTNTGITSLAIGEVDLLNGSDTRLAPPPYPFTPPATYPRPLGDVAGGITSSGGSAPTISIDDGSAPVISID